VVGPVESGGNAHRDQDRRAELPLVNAGTEHVDARAEAVPLDAKHGLIIRIPAAGARGTVAAFVTSRRHVPFR
jgi:hypothetical protein